MVRNGWESEKKQRRLHDRTGLQLQNDKLGEQIMGMGYKKIDCKKAKGNQGERGQNEKNRE